MTDVADNPAKAAFPRERPSLAVVLLLGFHVIACCASLTYVASLYTSPQIIAFDSSRILPAALTAAPFALTVILFALSRFSFGYFLGFYFHAVILSYLWLVEFSVFPYEHRWTAVSAALSGLFFLLPALAVTSPIRHGVTLSPRAFDAVLTAILVIATATIAIGALSNFRVVGIDDIYAFRDHIRFTTPLGYAIGVTATVLLPFAFAGFALRSYRWRAFATLALLLLFYPVTLTKLALFAPLWLLFLFLLSRFVEIRMAIVLSLCMPLAAGVVLAAFYKLELLSYGLTIPYVGAINFRMIAVPAIALDIYNDFFATHPHTYFCQISILKRLVPCPYSESLAALMADNYHLGNLNASLFATEGIASVGPALAPLAALASGLVIALGNRASAGLPPRFVLVSAAVLVQSFLNVPLTTALLTNGAALLFLLWYVTPRTIFDGK